MGNKDKQQQFMALYGPVHERFERFCRARAYGKLDPKDLMNETLLVAYQKLDKLRSQDAFFSFLVGISVRLLANFNRKRHEEYMPEHGPDPVDSSVVGSTDADVQLLHQALALLPEEQRESLILFEISGFSIKEVAAIQRASESAVKQRLRRGREKLASVLNVKPMKAGQEVAS